MCCISRCKNTTNVKLKQLCMLEIVKSQRTTWSKIFYCFFFSLSLMPKSSQYDASRANCNCSLPSPFTQTWWPSFAIYKTHFSALSLSCPFIVRACRGRTCLYSLISNNLHQAEVKASIAERCKGKQSTQLTSQSHDTKDVQNPFPH